MSQELAADLAMTMVRLIRRLKASHEGARLSQPCASALAVIVSGGRIRAGDVARIEGITPASITPVLKELTTQRLIIRTLDPKDRRSAWLTPTAKGRRWFEEGHIRAVMPLAVAIAGLTPSARETLQASLPFLREIEAALEQKDSAS